MKKFLKTLGIITLAAAVVPCKVEKDEETGVKTYQTLLSKLRVNRGGDGEGTAINLDLLGGVIPTALGKPEEDYADDELDLDGLETEPVFEVSLKVERDVPAEPEARESEEPPVPPVPPVPPAPPETPEVPGTHVETKIDL